ncbi:MAG: winged helix DNA-binding domain-containing protein [Anaerolineae bacterium]|nr:winged helix DNA-binding domain-containing protein [Anaerolineae bacterium]
MTKKPAFTLDTVRELTVVKQGLHQRPANTHPEALRSIIQRIGLLQLDSVSVTARSHYLVMLSRAGLYDRDDLDSLLTSGQLFEYWAHAQCLIPIESFPYFKPLIDERRAKRKEYYRGMGSDPETTLNLVLQQIRDNGAMASKDFESPRNGESGWWNWKPAKVALEFLFDHGHLMISHRVNFHRYYELTERVLEKHGFKLDKTLEDWHRWAVVAGLRQQGMGVIADIADYYRLSKRTTQEMLNELVSSGEVLSLEVEGLRGPVYLHRDDLPLAQAVADGQHAPQVTTFLSPFDNLVWYRDRAEAVFKFYYRIEMYTPAAKRQYGYYVLPILHRGQLVGRIDPKIDRKAKRFIMRALHLEPDTVITDELVSGLADAIREFMAFHNCTDFALESSPSLQLEDALFAAL